MKPVSALISVLCGIASAAGIANAQSSSTTYVSCQVTYDASSGFKSTHIYEIDRESRTFREFSKSSNAFDRDWCASAYVCLFASDYVSLTDKFMSKGDTIVVNFSTMQYRINMVSGRAPIVGSCTRTSNPASRAY